MTWFLLMAAVLWLDTSSSGPAGPQLSMGWCLWHMSVIIPTSWVAVICDWKVDFSSRTDLNLCSCVFILYSHLKANIQIQIQIEQGHMSFPATIFVRKMKSRHMRLRNDWSPFLLLFAVTGTILKGFCSNIGTVWGKKKTSPQAETYVCLMGTISMVSSS